MMLIDILVEIKALSALVSSLAVIESHNIGIFMCDEKILFITKSDVVGQRREQAAICL